MIVPLRWAFSRPAFLNGLKKFLATLAIYGDIPGPVMGASLSALSHFGIPVIIQDIQVIRPLKHYEGLHPKLESVGENTKKKNPQIMITDDSSGKVTCNWKSRT